MTAVEWLTDQLQIDGGTMRDKALEMERQQMEISDDEILKAAKECRFLDWDNSVGSFELGAQWYREQLKQKL